jgi:hypothetical protein
MEPEPSHYEYQLGSVRDNRNRNDIARLVTQGV